MRFLVATTLVAAMGCGFEHGQLDDPSEAPDASPTPGTGSDGGSGTPTTAIDRTCAFPSPDNRLCLEFTDGVLTPVLHDASAMPLDPAASGLTAVMRSTDPAVGVTLQSHITVAETPKLDISGKITLEAWIRADFPQPVSIIRNAGQYEFKIDGTGHVACTLAGITVTSYNEGPVPLGQWTHVACTYDGDHVRVFRGGSTQDCGGTHAPIATGGTMGTAIAPDFTGQLDGVRIYSRDIGADVCKHATGRTDCQRQCGIQIDI